MSERWQTVDNGPVAIGHHVLLPGRRMCTVAPCGLLVNAPEKLMTLSSPLSQYLSRTNGRSTYLTPRRDAAATHESFASSWCPNESLPRAAMWHGPGVQRALPRRAMRLRNTHTGRGSLAWWARSGRREMQMHAHVNGEVAAKWVRGTQRTMVLYRAPSDEVRRTPLVAAAPLAYSCLRHDPQRQISRRAD